MNTATPLAVDRLLSDNEAAPILGVKVQTIRNWRCTKLVKLPYVKVGAAVRYRLSDLEKFVEQNTVGAK